jgi:hypothetical protein
LIRWVIGNSRRLVRTAALVAALSPLHATLANAGEGATAEALFREAKGLMAKRRYAEACPKLEQSQRLDPGGGTLLNLAICHEEMGRTATAWGEMAEALAQARKDGRADRERFAAQRIAKLESKLSRLVVELGPGAGAPELRIERDGVLLEAASLGVALPVDPGTHVVAARARGRLPWETRVVVGPSGDRVVVTVPALAPEPLDAGKGSPPARAEGGGGARVAAWIVGAAGVSAIGLGGYFGARAIEKEQEAEARCRGLVCANAVGLSASEDARRSARIADVAIGAGVLGVGASALLFWASRPSREGAVQVAPAVSASSAGIVVGGLF